MQNEVHSHWLLFLQYIIIQGVLTIRLEAGVEGVSQDDDPQATSNHEVVQANENHHTRYIPSRTVYIKINDFGG